MPVKAVIVGNKGNPLSINEDGGIDVTIAQYPAISEARTALPYRSFFLNDVSNDMRVDGSTTNVVFSIIADGDYDYYIKSINVEIADAGAKFNLFGALAALTNGVTFEWFKQDIGTQTIHDGLKDNLDFFRLSDQVPTIIDLSGGGADAVIVHIDLLKLFGMPWGVKLRKGSTDRLSFTVRDDLSAGITTYNTIGYGIRI